MSYPGNSSLGNEVRQRILSTFSQSLDLAETGKGQEAALGCDFILELDPQFEPARLLKERLESGQDGRGLEDLRAVARGDAPPPPAGGASPGGEEPSADDLFDLDDFDLPDLDSEGDSQGGAPPGQARPEPPIAAAGGLRSEIERLMGTRSYQAVLDRASQSRDEVMADPELSELVQKAQSRLEAQPYVESFLQKASAALRGGDTGAAKTALDQARSLDPDHPMLDELAAGLADRAPAAGSAGPEADERPGTPSLDDASAELDLQAGEDLIGASAPLEGSDGLPPLEEPAPPEAGGAPGPGSGTEPSQEDDRIAQLLAEGQEAADRGDHQAAIDAWSRIFLIDVDHEEAARRIEEARRLKAERERQVEEIFHDGLDALERDDRDAARERFERVLEVQPNHLAAREYLDQIESGGPVTGPGPSADETSGVPDLGSFDLADLSGEGKGGGEREGSGEPLQQEILVPPEPGQAGSGATQASSTTGGAAPPRRMAAGASSGRRSFLLIGGAVLVVVLVAGWFLFQNWERFFPNSSAGEAASATQQEAGPSVIDRARSLHEGGNTAMAVGQLKRIRPDHPDYERAQELIAEWEAPQEAEAPEASEPTISAEDLERRQGLLARADRAFERSEYLRALELYDDARDVAPLEDRNLERFQQAAKRLEPLSSQIELFREGEYEMVLPQLWRMLEEDPSDRDVRRLLVDSYYNRGVRELQRGDADRAAAEFREALSLAPDDQELQRHFQFAQAYQRRSKDLLYRIYVKYLPFR